MRKIEVKQASSNIKDENEAVEAIYSQLGGDPASLNFMFCSASYNSHILGSAIKRNFKENVVACTSSGEISPLGISNEGIVAASISSDSLKFKKYFIENISKMDITRALTIAEDFKLSMGITKFDESKQLGIVIIDGLSMLEDKVIALLSKAMAPLNIIGGSAGDDMKFETTKVYSQGNFENNSAVLVLIETDLPKYR